MSEPAPKRVYSFRLDPDLVTWVDAYAKEIGDVKRTTVVEALLCALRDGRLWVEPDTRPNPFPGVTRTELLPVRPFGGVRPGTYPHRESEKETVECE